MQQIAVTITPNTDAFDARKLTASVHNSIALAERVRPFAVFYRAENSTGRF